MKKRSILDSPRFLELKKQKYKALKKKTLIWIISFSVFFLCISFFSKWKNLNIQKIETEGNRIIDTIVLESLIKEKISSKYIWFFPKTNFLLYPKKEIKEELSAKFKRLKNIELNLKDLQTLSVSLTERSALYTWCGAKPLPVDNSSESEDGCYFMDETGYIFDKAPYFSGQVYLKFFGSIETSDHNPLGFYFKEKDFKNLVLYKEELEKIGLKLTSFYIGDDDDIRVALTSTSAKKSPEIIFKADSSLEQVIKNLDATLNTEPFLSDFKNKYSLLSYIDLRFGNKVYYKFNE